MDLFDKLDPTIQHFQCSYNVDKTARLVLDSGKLVARLLEGDLPFNPKTPTKPRSEFRSNTLADGPHSILTEVCLRPPPKEMQYSVFQIFASNPEVMIRKRTNKWQIVVFSCKEKITEIPDLFEDGRPNKIKVDVVPTSAKFNRVVVTVNGQSWTFDSKFKQRGKLYVKCGVYAQQMDPVGETVAQFNYLVDKT